MKTKKPSAIVYGWDEEGETILTSQINWEEHLFDDKIYEDIVYFQLGIY